MTKPFVWVPSAEFMRQEFFCAHLQEPAAWLEEGVSEFCWNWEMTLLFGQNTKELLYKINFNMLKRQPSNETIHFLASFCIDTRPVQAFFEATRKVLWLGGILQVIMVAFFGAAATWPGRWDCIFGTCFLNDWIPQYLMFHDLCTFGSYYKYKILSQGLYLACFWERQHM